MKVRIIAATQPTQEFISDLVDENTGLDIKNVNGLDIVSYCARVSNPNNQSNFSTSGKLLKYCAEKEHWSIFEMINIVMEINTTRDIGRQILRHKSFSFQEFSQRYADPTKLGYEVREARLQDTKNRQNSIENDDVILSHVWEANQKAVYDMANKAYEWAIDNGVAKEQARVVLPEGMTMSRMYMSGSLRSWIHFCRLRMGNGTQKEHREIASLCWNEIVKMYPDLQEIVSYQVK